MDWFTKLHKKLGWGSFIVVKLFGSGSRPKIPRKKSGAAVPATLEKKRELGTA
jgi:hypothetical protein